MSQAIRFSEYAASIYLAAQGIEVQALCVYAIETQGLDKKARIEYNKLVSSELDLSLKTMQNRASVAAKIQDKYGVTLAGCLEANEETVRSLTHFLTGEMDKTEHKFQRHLDDISRFLANEVPARVAAEQAAQRAKEAADARKAAQAAADAKQAEAAAANQADTSGTPGTPSTAAAQPEGTPVGNADSSENRNPAPASSVVPLPAPAPLPDYLLTVERDAKGELVIGGAEKMELDELAAVVKQLQAVLKIRKTADAPIKKAA